MSRLLLSQGGHLGLMSSKRSADEFWPQLAQWLSETFK